LIRALKGKILLAFLLMCIWLLLTYPIDMEEVFAGAAIVLLIVIFLGKRANTLSALKLNPKSLVCSIAYIFLFLWELLKANFDVASRVVSPSLPINPGIVKVRTRLQSGIGRVVLANSITLTPGTLTVEIKDDFLYIHWIDVTAGNIDEATAEIVSRFDSCLRGIFE